MNRALNTFLIPIVGLSMAACATIYYEPPAGAPQAKLSIRTNAAVKRVIGAAVYARTDCSDGGKGLVYRAIQPGDTRVFALEAGRPLTLAVAGHDDSAFAFALRNCQAPVTFTPRAGANYVATYREEGSTCTTQVEERVDGGAMVAVDARTKTSIQGALRCQ